MQGLNLNKLDFLALRATYYIQTKLDSLIFTSNLAAAKFTQTIPRARQEASVDWIWPTGLSLPTPDFDRNIQEIHLRL